MQRCSLLYVLLMMLVLLLLLLICWSADLLDTAMLLRALAGCLLGVLGAWVLAACRGGRFNNNEDLDKDENGVVKVPNKINGELAEPQNIRSARAILGPEQHQLFVDNGGHSNDVQLAWNEMVRVHEEVEDILSESAGEDDPK